MSARIERITIENYRSIGSKYNSIYMSDDVIAIVGKNGSGKSNIISALSGLQFFSQEDHATLNDYNLFLANEATTRPDVKISFQISMKPEDYKCIVPETLQNSLHDEKIRLDFFRYNSWGYFMHFQADAEETDKTPCIFTKIMDSDEKLVEYVTLLHSALKNDSISPNNGDRDKHAGILYWCEHWNHLHSQMDYDWIRSHYRNEISEDKINYIRERYNAKMKEFATVLPKIVIYKDQQFSDRYTKEDVTRDNRQFFKRPSALKYLLDAIEIPVDTFIEALENPQQRQRTVASARKKNSRLINSFNDNFNNFYNNSSEQIELTLDFDNGCCLLQVTSLNNDVTFNISERSNGLKWYLAFFAALHSAKALKNALVLIDEPAVHLHVDAQKEVLRLFNDLSEEKLQIIYTTHSPAMLDINSWERIRLVEKYNDISYIYGIQSSHVGIKQLETLSPIQHAMGCCLKYTLAPDATRCNIVTEGITDYYYLKAMLKILRIPEDSCYIIPACGADNVPNTLSILYGWGYKVKVLLDHDDKGKQVACKIKKEFPDDYSSIVTFVSTHEGDTIESLLDSSDFERVRITGPNQSFCKVPTALSFMKSAQNTTHHISRTTEQNFRILFVNLGILPQGDCGGTEE